MLNRAARPFASSSNGYVCASCRCQSLKSLQAQVRWQGHVTTDTSDDSWFDTINQISEDFRANGLRRGPSKAENPKKDSQVTRDGGRKGAPASSASKERSKPSKATANSSSVSKSTHTPPVREHTKASTSKPLTIAQKVREARERAKWGGMSEGKRVVVKSKRRPSHDSLRKADKVSPAAIIETAVNKRPYGFESATDGVAQAEAPAEEGQDREEGNPESAQTELPKSHGKSKTSITRRELRERRKAKRLAAQLAKTTPSKDASSANFALETPHGSFMTLENAMGVKTASMQSAKETKLEKKETKPKKKEKETKSDESKEVTTEINTVAAEQLHIEPLDIPQPPVPYLQHGLDKVLFNPGVYHLQDPTSRVYNFDPYLQKIMPVAEFDFDALKEYKTSSQDRALASLAREHGKKYIGSTSSMTSSLAHFHYLLSGFRPLNLDMISRGFNPRGPASDKFTLLNQAPSAIFLRWKDGSYAIDADKEFDSGNVLMLLGKSMELLLTQPKSEYERYRKSDPRQVPEEQRTAPESYQYTTMGDFLMRSQLDAYDPRLPDNGTFDLKTRAVVSVRMDAQDYEPMTGYELYTLQGKWGSYEREYYDMMRATMLKYMLQARMGRMNGIFVAYHNVKRIFGFQYVPMRDMDLAIHGQVDPSLGDQEFRFSLDLLNKLLDKATAKFPKQSLRIHFEARQDEQRSKDSLTSLHVFAEPMTESEIDEIQNTGKAKIQEFERTVMGLDHSSSSSSSSETSDPTPSDPTDAPTPTPSAAPSPETPTPPSASAKEDELKPLFYATLLVKSKVNGWGIDGAPSNLSRDSKWSIDYLLQEYTVGRPEWAAYAAMKARRRAELENDAEEDKSGDYYIRFLRDMAAKGKTLRQRIDALEEGKVPVVAGEPLSAVRENVDGVEGYLKELYARKGN